MALHDYYSEGLEKAIQNSIFVLRYAVENNYKIESKYYKSLVKTRELFEKGQLTSAEETEFWIALNKIHEKIDPINTHQIIAVTKKRPFFPKWMPVNWRFTEARWSTGLYTFFAIFFLLLTLVFQVFTIIGVELVTNINKYDKELTSLNHEIRLLQNQRDAASHLFTFTELNDKYEEYDQRRKLNIIMLAKWDNLVKSVTGNTNRIDLEFLKNPIPENISSVEYEKKINELYATHLRVQQEASHPLIIMQTFILPLLYGLLGAWVYVLRTIEEEIRNFRYSFRSNIRFAIRLTLGLLAGITVGFIISPKNLAEISTVGSLTPMALAFLAGFSIEFFFNLLEGFITLPKTRSESKKR